MKYVVLHQGKLVLQAQNKLRNYHSRGITDLKMPTNLVQINSQCYGFIDNTKGKNISQTKKKKKKLYIYIYIYIQYIIYTEIRSEAFVLALQQKQLVPLPLVQGEPRTFPH